MFIENIEMMDEIKGKSKLNGQLAFRWHDHRLTWDPLLWGGVELIQLSNQLIWLPDLTITNHTDRRDQQQNNAEFLVRVSAVRAEGNDVEENIFNVEQSPVVSLQFPIDTQKIFVRIESWMTLEKAGQIKIMGLSQAISGSKDIDYNFKDTDAISLQDVYVEFGEQQAFGYTFQSTEFHIIVKRTNYKYFTSIYVPSIVILFLALLNVMISDRGVKVQNSITLLIVNTLFLTVNQSIIPTSASYGLQELGCILMFSLLFLATVMDQISNILESQIDDIYTSSKSNQGDGAFNELSLPQLITKKYKYSLDIIDNSTIFTLAFCFVLNIEVIIWTIQTGFLFYFLTILNVSFSIIIQQIQSKYKVGLSSVNYLNQITQVQRKNKNEIDNKIHKQLKNIEILNQNNMSNYSNINQKVTDENLILKSEMLIEITKIFVPQMISNTQLLYDSLNQLLSIQDENEDNQISKYELAKGLLSLSEDFNGQFTDKHSIDKFIDNQLSTLRRGSTIDKSQDIDNGKIF